MPFLEIFAPPFSQSQVCHWTLQKVLKQGLILQMVNQVDHFLKKNNKKRIGLMKDELGGKIMTKYELGGKIMTKFVELRANIYIYLIDDGSKNKKGKGIKKCVIKRKLKFEKNKIDIDILKKEYKELKKNNKLIN